MPLWKKNDKSSFVPQVDQEVLITCLRALTGKTPPHNPWDIRLGSPYSTFEVLGFRYILLWPWDQIDALIKK
ncbi:hypothetical protein CDAR_503091 [Caerostris darwini]|uniref:Uncharacterized protein n=1 Tax=Caerostris darwini TaxID=1538125 RepID=A0AAV4VNT4_9ARAC|nr:hypothetical protein CDAR_503091 [Caerostris darwini]